MSDIVLDTEATPSIPSSGSAVLYVDSTSKLVSSLNDAGLVQTVPFMKSNQSVAIPGAGFATDTYLVGSSIAFGAHVPRVGGTYWLAFDVSKTAAGSATPIVTLRFGTAGSTADTSRLAFTFGAGTAAADTGQFDVMVCWQTVGSGTSAVLQGTARCTHGLSATTGIINLVAQTVSVTSAGFDSTPVNSILGVSVNAGASAAWTISLVRAEYTSF